MSKKKYAFVSDIVRLYALYNYGGIYLDSDIKVLKNFDDLLANRAFTGFESKDYIGVWLWVQNNITHSLKNYCTAMMGGISYWIMGKWT